jgi:hypothetical protein
LASVAGTVNHVRTRFSLACISCGY